MPPKRGKRKAAPAASEEPPAAKKAVANGRSEAGNMKSKFSGSDGS